MSEPDRVNIHLTPLKIRPALRLAAGCLLALSPLVSPFFVECFDLSRSRAAWALVLLPLFLGYFGFSEGAAQMRLGNAWTGAAQIMLTLAAVIGAFFAAAFVMAVTYGNGL